MIAPALTRFLGHVVESPDGCWLWRAGHDKDGYGRFDDENGKTMQAHRYAFAALVGPIPAGLSIDHLCRNRACVNPVHLEPVTHAENMRRNALLRTHCANGHPFDEANTYTRPSGARDCRTCHTARERDRRVRLREQAA